MYRDYKQTFSYEAHGEFALPRDISLQEFITGAKDLLDIIKQHYELIENSPEMRERVIIDGNNYNLKEVEKKAGTKDIFNFSGEIPFHTHKARGTIRTGIAKVSKGKYIAQTIGGLSLSIIPPFEVLSTEINPLWSLTSLVPNLLITAPGVYGLYREERRQSIKTLELELHVLGKRSTHTGQVENLLRYLQDYRI